MKNRTVYLDNAAATPLDPIVKRAMDPFFNLAYGNPSSLHHKGVEARLAVEKSRKIISGVVNSRDDEIIFTSGGTEGCNLAIFGVAQGRGKGHIITTQIEHHAVLEPIKQLIKRGWKATFLPVNKEGFVNSLDVQKAIRKDTVLVSVMYANNEIGSIQPVAEIGRMLRAQNAKRKAKNIKEIIFHTDACQAAGFLDLNVNKLQVDLMSVSASKFYGPKGMGFLYVRRGTPIAPIVLGGGQETGFRSGTENVAGVVGMAKAMELVNKNKEVENRRLADMRDYCTRQVKKIFPKVLLNGPQILNYPISSKNDGRYKLKMWNRLPNNLNFTFPGIEGEALMLYLDAKGVCVSTGSACATGATDASHVLVALGRTEAQAKESIRVTLGSKTSKKDLDYFVKVLKQNILLILDEQ